MRKLIAYLLNERKMNMQIPDDKSEQFKLYRSLINTRPANIISEDYIREENNFLQNETAKKGITNISELNSVEKNIYLWQGDITTLKCGAIVNAANSGMTGCYIPCHSCIDNCIHTFAGVQLRLECAVIMEEQDCEEQTGQAKITSAYNLPCDYVIHTVGPIVDGNLTGMHCELLKSSYKSCLELAVQHKIMSIAFCCISTGVFGFPKYEAAEIAVSTVRNFIKNNDIQVIFNVFEDYDYEIYKSLLG